MRNRIYYRYKILGARSKAWACGHSLAGIMGSNTAGGLDICLLCCQVEVSASGWSLVQRSPTECGVSELYCKASIMRRPCPNRGCCAMKKNKIFEAGPKGKNECLASNFGHETRTLYNLNYKSKSNPCSREHGIRNDFDRNSLTNLDLSSIWNDIKKTKQNYGVSVQASTLTSERMSASKEKTHLPGSYFI
jgi:hypothetical protein